MGKAAQYLSAGELESIVKSRKGGELIGLCPNHEASLISGQFSVACHLSGGQVAASAIPAPLLKNNTNQSLIIQRTGLAAVRVLLGDALTRFRAARLARLFNFENGREMGNKFCFCQKFRRLTKRIMPWVRW